MIIKIKEPFSVMLINVAIRVLNEAFAHDPVAIRALLCNSVPCNTALMNHKTVEVNKIQTLHIEDLYDVGMLGILNGVMFAMLNQRIVIKWSEPSSEGISKMLGFERHSGQM